MYRKNHFLRYAYRIWRYLVGATLCWARIRSKKLIRGVSCIHKGQKCIQILWGIRIKSPFLKTYKECTICAILRENTLFCLATTEAKTCCAMLRRGPKIMQLPPWNQKQSLLRRKSAILSVRWKFHCIENIILALCLYYLAIVGRHFFGQN